MGCRVQGVGCMRGLGCRVKGAGCRVQGVAFRIQGAGLVEGRAEGTDTHPILHGA